MMQLFYRTADLKRFSIRARDGDIGKLEEVYFDDSSWSVRYVVVNTGTWLLGRRVLIVPKVVEGLDDSAKSMTVALDREQVKNSPPMDKDKPIARRYEEEYYRYYKWAPYWGTGVSAEPYPPPSRTIARSLDEGQVSAEQIRQSHLRSSSEVSGYYVEAHNGEIGHVEDLVIEAQHWQIQYVEVDTRNWWPGKKVLVPRTWIRDFQWLDRKVRVAAERQTLQAAPEYDASRLITPDYEIELFQYYSQHADALTASSDDA